MSTHPNDAQGSVTTYTYAPGDVAGGAVTWTVYGADGRVVAHGSGPTPDGLIDTPEPSNPRDGDPPDEPHVVE